MKTPEQIKSELINLAFDFRDSNFECTANCDNCPLLFELDSGEFQPYNMCDVLIAIVNKQSELELEGVKISDFEMGNLSSTLLLKYKDILIEINDELEANGIIKNYDLDAMLILLKVKLREE